jgi:hypothetical protein
MTIACWKAGSIRLIRSKGNASGHTAIGKFSFQPPRATPSAAQEKKTEAILRKQIIMMDQNYTVQCQLGNRATIIAASPVVSWFETRTAAEF